MNSFILLCCDPDNDGRVERRGYAGLADCAGELNIACIQGVAAARRTAADKDRFSFDPMLLENAALLCDPDRAVGRAKGAHADANPNQNPSVSRKNAGECRDQKSPVIP